MQINGYGEQFYAKFSTDTQNKAITCFHANTLSNPIHLEKIYIRKKEYKMDFTTQIKQIYHRL